MNINILCFAVCLVLLRLLSSEAMRLRNIYRETRDTTDAYRHVNAQTWLLLCPIYILDLEKDVPGMPECNISAVASYEQQIFHRDDPR